MSLIGWTCAADLAISSVDHPLLPRSYVDQEDSRGPTNTVLLTQFSGAGRRGWRWSAVGRGRLKLPDRPVVREAVWERRTGRQAVEEGHLNFGFAFEGRKRID